VALFNNAANGFDRSRIDWFATVRGRLGYAFDRLLIYGTGGVAFADRQDRPTPCVGYATAGAGIASGQALVGTGFYVTPDAETAGGVEYAFTNNLTARIEGLYAAFGRDRGAIGCCLTGGNVVGVTNTGAPVFADTSGAGFGHRSQRDDIAVVRAGLNFKFNTP